MSLFFIIIMIKTEWEYGSHHLIFEVNLLICCKGRCNEFNYYLWNDIETVIWFWEKGYWLVCIKMSVKVCSLIFTFNRVLLPQKLINMKIFVRNYPDVHNFVEQKNLVKNLGRARAWRSIRIKYIKDHFLSLFIEIWHKL